VSRHLAARKSIHGQEFTIMAFRHWFMCLAPTCGKHIVFMTEESMPVQPGRTHGEALENGGQPMPANSGGTGCLGALIYCAGYQPKTKKDCTIHKRGTEEFAPQPVVAVDPAWTDFATKVTNAWQAFQNSGWNLALRGANNYGEYRAPPGVKNILQRSGGVVVINGGTYTVSNSLTAGVSLHRQIPGGGFGAVQSFIYHL
jgi:hypothetical protein